MSAIRMSSGFGSSGQKRTPEKVVMEPSGIQPKNHAGYNEHNTPCCFRQRHKGRRSLGYQGTDPPAWWRAAPRAAWGGTGHDSGPTPPQRATATRSEEHTSELQSPMY